MISCLNLLGTIETLAFRDVTNGSDSDLGNFTVTDKFNCRDYRVNLYFPEVSNVTLDLLNFCVVYKCNFLRAYLIMISLSSTFRKEFTI